MSGFLVDQLDATAEKGSLTSALSSVYCHLAKTWMSPFPAAKEKPVEWRDYARRIQQLSDRIDIPKAPHIPGGKWAAADLLGAIHHIEVLLRASLALEAEKWALKRCAATQQHVVEGEYLAAPSKIADLEGKDEKGEAFALEAFGGLDYRNDSKLALDLNALRQSKKARTLLAAKKTAWPANLTTQVSASCEKRNGGPFMIGAKIVKRWEDDQLLVLELTEITRDAVRPPREMS
ncbi:MAG: hypothetical protein ABI461_06140 [Polyangiaceae bacterium]